MGRMVAERVVPLVLPADAVGRMSSELRCQPPSMLLAGSGTRAVSVGTETHSAGRAGGGGAVTGGDELTGAGPGARSERIGLGRRREVGGARRRVRKGANGRRGGGRCGRGPAVGAVASASAAD